MGISWLVPVLFATVIVFLLWRPRNLNEAIPTTLGALAVLALGFISWNDVTTVFHVVSGAGVTILSTIIMSSVLDRAGFFRWAAVQVAIKARGSGIRLFIYVLFLCFCMTMFFNNDGSILITTPIILEITRRLRFTKLQSLPYLLGGALIATSSSAPIGVSNLANLIALRIVGLDLNTYAQLMFLPSMIGIAGCGYLLYLVLKKNIPRRYEVAYLSDQVFPPLPGRKIEPLRAHVPPPISKGKKGQHSLFGQQHRLTHHNIDPVLFGVGIAVVILVRIGFFVGALWNIPIEWIAVGGAVFLLLFYTTREPRGVWPILREAPWDIVVFAFSMYMLVFSLHNQGLTTMLGTLWHAVAGQSLFGAITTTGVFLTIMSCMMNNLPSVMIGTVMLTDLHLPSQALQLSYLANVLGSDIGSLLLPMGTLASLLWFKIVSKRLDITWMDYMKISFLVIPPSLLLSLVALWAWGSLILP